MNSRIVQTEPRLRATILVRFSLASGAVTSLNWREFQRRYAPVIAGFAREIGVSDHDAHALSQDVFRLCLRSSGEHRFDSENRSFRRYLLALTLEAMRIRLHGREEELGWTWDEAACEAAVVENVWDEAWEEHLLPRALLAIREQCRDPRMFQAFFRHAVADDELDEVVQAVGLSPCQVLHASDQLSASLQAHMRRIRREEG